MYYSDHSDDDTPVRTALLLAAGTGSRLSPLTDSTPKCLVEVNGIPILERLVRSLRSHGFKRLVVVVGHLSEVIQDYLGSRYADIEITYIYPLEQCMVDRITSVKELNPCSKR